MLKLISHMEQIDAETQSGAGGLLGDGNGGVVHVFPCERTGSGRNRRAACCCAGTSNAAYVEPIGPGDESERQQDAAAMRRTAANERELIGAQTRPASVKPAPWRQWSAWQPPGHNSTGETGPEPIGRPRRDHLESKRGARRRDPSVRKDKLY